MFCVGLTSIVQKKKKKCWQHKALYKSVSYLVVIKVRNHWENKQTNIHTEIFSGGNLFAKVCLPWRSRIVAVFSCWVRVPTFQAIFVYLLLHTSQTLLLLTGKGQSDVSNRRSSCCLIYVLFIYVSFMYYFFLIVTLPGVWQFIPGLMTLTLFKVIGMSES